MKVLEQTSRNGLTRVRAGNWVVEFPTIVPFKKKTIGIELLDPDGLETRDVILDGYVMRSFDTHCLASCGGLILQIPEQIPIDAHVRVGVTL